MNIVGTVESLWRYPVKSMRGEELEEMFAGFSGVYGDRLFAFRSSANRKGFPYFTAREQREMLRFRPKFRHPEKAAAPVNLTEAESVAPGENPIYADPAELMVDVETPSGDTLAVDKRRFRANIYLDLKTPRGFAEDNFVGRSLRVGRHVILSILERDPRCMIITLDPDTGAIAPALLKKVAQAHNGMAGVYGAVLAEGMV